MSEVSPQFESQAIFDKLDELGLRQRELAGVLGIEENKITKVKRGVRRFTAGEVAKATAWLREVEQRGGYSPQADFPSGDTGRDYLPVEILPSFAGMGGGGNGDGEPEFGMVPRRLIVDEFRAKASDFLLIDTRGDSAEPEFSHGDQILIDRRDRNPVQPGSFCLWDGDGYVIKGVERIPQRKGWYRVFSNNPKYQSYEAEEENIQIMGRPVWFARRL